MIITLGDDYQVRALRDQAKVRVSKRNGRKNLVNLSAEEVRWLVLVGENLASDRPEPLDLWNGLTPIFNANPNFVALANEVLGG